MKNIFNGIYQGKRVLVTGHTGFKGSWLSIWLEHLGAEVIGYALSAPTEPSMFNLAKVDRHVTSIEGDVRDGQHLQDVVQEYKPDMVFHLAAQPIVRLSYREPVVTYETNIMGTVNLLEAVRKSKSVRVCTIITTDKCYENREWIYAYRENDRLGGYDPYSSSKACAELIVSSYRNSFFNPDEYGRHGMALASVRAGNVIGGGDWAPDRIVPDTIRFLADNNPATVRNPLAIRPWQHVLEPLAGYLWVSALMWQHGIEYSSAWNFGPDSGDSLTVGQLVDIIIDRWGNGEWSNNYSDNMVSQLHEANVLKLDCTKARTLLRWSPVLAIDEALDFTIMWYRSVYNQTEADIYKLTTKQIETYVKKAQNLSLMWSRGGKGFDYQGRN